MSDGESMDEIYKRISHRGGGATYAAQRTIQPPQEEQHALHAVQEKVQSASVLLKDFLQAAAP